MTIIRDNSAKDFRRLITKVHRLRLQQNSLKRTKVRANKRNGVRHVLITWLPFSDQFRPENHHFQI